MQSLDLDVLERALEWKESGKRVWLVTVAQTFGASPRPPGSLLAIREDGILVGSVSGGCIEDDTELRHGHHDGRHRSHRRKKKPHHTPILPRPSEIYSNGNPLHAPGYLSRVEIRSL